MYFRSVSCALDGFVQIGSPPHFSLRAFTIPALVTGVSSPPGLTYRAEVLCLLRLNSFFLLTPLFPLKLPSFSLCFQIFSFSSLVASSNVRTTGPSLIEAEVVFLLLQSPPLHLLLGLNFFKVGDFPSQSSSSFSIYKMAPASVPS